MALTKYKLGMLIVQSDARNSESVYGIDDVRGTHRVVARLLKKVCRGNAPCQDGTVHDALRRQSLQTGIRGAG